MKKVTILTPIIAIALIIGFGVAILTLKSSNDIEKVESERPVVLSMTASIPVPDEMTFAGERIVFDRYDRRERMDRELSSFTYFHSTTLLLFKRANRIFPIIEPIMRQHGFHDDFKYLAVIESSLDPFAVSTARAVGLWQFMEATGREYGLEINEHVDERYHLEKSTAAAARYLQRLHRTFGSWSAASLAYNGGQGRISNALQDQRESNALDLWLVSETTRYYYRMLAMKEIFENPFRYGFVINPEHLYKPIGFKEVTVTSTIADLVAFAQEHGITFAQLREFNPWLRSRRLPVSGGKTYTVLIPAQESMYYRKGVKPMVHDARWIAN
ncbi:MAG: lytic transglycosylase domain-containing protein [Dysgonamonadaceae bacterium]|jgi:hypothetical protein|nr:lytic transglycosylase domain-containing protein [Dysgonamonadaceae bacterium]